MCRIARPLTRSQTAGLLLSTSPVSLRGVAAASVARGTLVGCPAGLWPSRNAIASATRPYPKEAKAMLKLSPIKPSNAPDVLACVIQQAPRDSAQTDGCVKKCDASGGVLRVARAADRDDGWYYL